MAGKDRADGIDSVVAIETFSTNANKGGDDRWLFAGELVYYDGMDDGVGFRARQPNELPSMVALDKYHALPLIKV